MTCRNKKKKNRWGLHRRTYTKIKKGRGLHRGIYKNEKKKSWRGLTLRD